MCRRGREVGTASVNGDLSLEIVSSVEANVRDDDGETVGTFRLERDPGVPALDLPVRWRWRFELAGGGGGAGPLT